MKTRLSVFVIIFGIALGSQASHIYVNGTVSGPWNVDTVFVSGDLNVENGNFLTINNGVLVLFTGHYQIRVDGQILAIGQVQDSIVFTVTDTTGFYNYETGDGSWNGFWFDHVAPVNDSSIFEYCKFEFGKASLNPDSTKWYGGAICARQFDRMRISNCRFTNNRAYKNGGAVYALNTDLMVKNCNFEQNYCGQATLYGYGGGLCLEYSDAEILGNTFLQNSSTGVGGGLSFEYSDPRISGNGFYDNYSAIGGGLVCLRSAGNRSFVNNLFIGNEAYFFGGGVAVLETTILFANNTISQNYSGAGGGLYFNANSFSVFKNNIVWGNQDYGGGGPQVYIWDTFSAPEFYYCDIQGGPDQFGGTGGGAGFTGIYEDCLEDDPEFMGTGAHPFSLEETSICVNSGTPDTTGLSLPDLDFAGNARLRNNRIDIGAYETQITTRLIERNVGYFNIVVSPNPVEENSIIQLDVIESGHISFELLNLTGKMISGTMKRFFLPGRNSIPVRDLILQEYNPGYYFLKVWDSNHTETVKILCFDH
ncbi:MAG: right-handed parallel beta-helix repeat-containing protein [Bacteroidales bacterium]|nr:right-handed parallel beta-helix repeat-containing protein [Bacteroidales bacterium]